MSDGIHIHDYTSGEPGPDDEQWTTEQMQAAFTPLSFAAPYIVVQRKSDGVRGTLQFVHSPRIYFNWSPSE